MSFAALPPPQERRLLLLLAALQFSHLLDYMILMPLGAELMPAFGLDAAQFGLLIGVYTLASAVTGLCASAWLDRGDRRRILLRLYAGFIIATLGCALAPNHALLLVARALAGACAGLMSATVMTLVADRVEAPRRGAAMGTVMSAFGASAVAGVPLGLLLADQAGWRMPFFAVALFASGVWLLLWRHLPSTPASAAASGAPPARLADLLRLPQLPLGWLLTFGLVSAGFLIVPYLGAFMSGNLGIGLNGLSWVYLCGGAATLFAAPRIGRAVDRYGAASTLVTLMVASVFAHLGFTHLQPAPLLLVSVAFMAFMVLTSLRAIPAMSLLASLAPPQLRGRTMAINMAASDSASGLAAWTAGLIVSAPAGAPLQHFGTLGWMAAGITGLGLLLLAVLLRLRQREARSVAIAGAAPESP